MTKDEALKLALEFMERMREYHGLCLPGELDSAMRNIQEVLKESKKVEVPRNGWHLREVLFDDGDPIAHREVTNA